MIRRNEIAITICLSLLNLQTLIALFSSSWTKSLRTGSTGVSQHEISIEINNCVSFRSRRAAAAIVSMQGKKSQGRLLSTRSRGCSALSMGGVVGDPYTAIMIVPTGIGASIGGYAGDALPSARLLSSVVDVLITHPNVLNGAMLSRPMENVLYVEGFALDQFSSGMLGLKPTTKSGQKIGLLLDSAIEENLITRHLQVADAARATLGIDVQECVITSNKVGVKIHISESGASWGSIENSTTLIEGARKLIENGCTAIAVVVRFPEDEDIDGENDGNGGISVEEAAARFLAYRQGQGVDGIAGAEALISHIITKKLQIPCAHAPAFDGMEPDDCVSPKAAAEELGYTFLPCVLSYLHRAPSLIQLNKLTAGNRKLGGLRNSDGVADSNGDLYRSSNEEYINMKNVLIADDVDALVVPVSALGGATVLSLISRHLETVYPEIRENNSQEKPFLRRNGKKEVLVIAVEENKTAMQVTGENLLNVKIKNEYESIKIVNNDDKNSENNSKNDSSDLYGNVVYVRSYAECAGILAAHKAGILLSSITSYVPKIKVTRL